MLIILLTAKSDDIGICLCVLVEHFYSIQVFVFICIYSNIIEFRKKYKDLVLDKHGIKLGFMSAFIKASCEALKHVPEINARIEGDQIVYNDFMDVSVAVATPKGLVTPVLRNCETMNFMQIEKAMSDLGKKVEEGIMMTTMLTAGKNNTKFHF
jgi:2-oxoglutarate dehydrogenase E2 component (dihydrolipoamide succinyltransferase)